MGNDMCGNYNKKNVDREYVCPQSGKINPYNNSYSSKYMAPVDNFNAAKGNNFNANQLPTGTTTTVIYEDRAHNRGNNFNG